MTRKRMLWLAEVVFLLVFFLGFGTTLIKGESMTPGLEEGDLLVYARGGPYHKGDVILFHVASLNRTLIKRIALGPGEVLPESPGDVLSENEYYVLGDNEGVSRDSRDPEIGIVNREQIKGVALYRIWPLEKWGRIGGRE
jgi:signal peptidase I